MEGGNDYEEEEAEAYWPPLGPKTAYGDEIPFNCTAPWGPYALFEEILALSPPLLRLRQRIVVV